MKIFLKFVREVFIWVAVGIMICLAFIGAITIALGPPVTRQQEIHGGK